MRAIHLDPELQGDDYEWEWHDLNDATQNDSECDLESELRGDDYEWEM